jgi:ABC-2 type transport system ATP-binding protein
MTVVSADHLHKHYGSNYALDDFSMRIEAKRIVGLIGPNGAGKTTLLRAIMGLNHVEGELSVLGLDPYSQRHLLMQRASYIADVGTLPRWIKVCELLDFVDGVHPSFSKQKALDTLSSTNIKLDARVKTLSKGMVTQLHLALVSSIDAELLVLDEPTLGLDIIYRQEFYDRVLSDFHEHDRSIIVSTHEVREIEHILTDVIFIANGKNILSIATEEIANRFHQLSVSEADLSRAQSLKPISQRTAWQGHELVFQDADPEQLKTLGEISTPNLAELFIACMGDAK